MEAEFRSRAKSRREYLTHKTQGALARLGRTLRRVLRDSWRDKMRFEVYIARAISLDCGLCCQVFEANSLIGLRPLRWNYPATPACEALEYKRSRDVDVASVRWPDMRDSTFSTALSRPISM